MRKDKYKIEMDSDTLEKMPIDPETRQLILGFSKQTKKGVGIGAMLSYALNIAIIGTLAVVGGKHIMARQDAEVVLHNLDEIGGFDVRLTSEWLPDNALLYTIEAGAYVEELRSFDSETVRMAGLSHTGHFEVLDTTEMYPKATYETLRSILYENSARLYHESKSPLKRVVTNVLDSL